MKGIWRYKNIKGIKKEFMLTQEEGDTPLEQVLLSSPILEEQILVKYKREDLNPTGSFKDRSLAYQISYYKQKGEKTVLISSSGNAAISAVSYCKLAGINIHIFVSDNISKDKKKRLEVVQTYGDVNTPNSKESKAVIHYSLTPKSDAIKFAKENKLVNLRPSFDDSAIEGFKTLGYEIARIADVVDSIFIPCSSGTSTIGIFNGLVEMQEELNIKLPQIHIVQTTKVQPIAKEFDRNYFETKDSLADAIVDRVANRKEKVLEVVEKTKGSGWVISDEEIIEIKETLDKKDIQFSNTAALSFAGIMKAIKNGAKFESPLAIISGL